MKPRHFLTVGGIRPEELERLLSRAAVLKAELKHGRRNASLAGKSLGLLFAKASTRTRVSFEVAMAQMGGASLFMSAQDLQLKRGEGLADTARTFSRYLNGLVIRTFAHEDIEAWASDATIPVINGLTDRHHPCQALADLFTMKERVGSLQGLVLAYIGDGNNVAHSLIEGAAASGMTIRLACPKGYAPDEKIVRVSQKAAAATGARIELLARPEIAARDADALYTDTWISMGQESEMKKRLKAFKGYRIDRSLLRLAKPGAFVMHCLPAYRGKEIAADVIDGPQSIVWEQAENRLHVQKALLEWLLV